MKKDLVLSSVQNSVSSIFSKEDVINLINSIEEGSSRKITTFDINRAIDKVVDYMDIKISKAEIFARDRPFSKNYIRISSPIINISSELVKVPGCFPQ